MLKKLVISIGLSLWFLICAGCSTEQRIVESEVHSVPDVETENQKNESSNSTDAQGESILPTITLEEASEFIIQMDAAMNELQEKAMKETAISMESDSYRESIDKYFDRQLADYAAFIYRLKKVNEQYVFDKQYAHRCFKINKNKEMTMLSEGNGFCEIGVTFTHKWGRDIDEEIVPVRIEWDKEWKITSISQWYNDFCYNYLIEEPFEPEFFSEEQAKKIVEQFGTGKIGEKLPLTIRTGDNGYILEESSEKILSAESVNELSNYEKYFAIQEIYARHGKKFADSITAQYFWRQTWYTPYEIVFSKEVLSEIEKANIRVLAQAGDFSQEAQPEYESLYPISEQKDMLTAEEAAVIIQKAFNAADNAILPKEENRVPKEDYDIAKIYSLGMYSDIESLKNYLSQWFAESVQDYVIDIYGFCNGLYQNEQHEYRVMTEYTYYGTWQRMDKYFPVVILSESETECLVEMPFVDYQVAWDEPAAQSRGTFLLEKQEDAWIITDMSQSYYNEIIENAIQEGIRSASM